MLCNGGGRVSNIPGDFLGDPHGVTDGGVDYDEIPASKSQFELGSESISEHNDSVTEQQ